jgi:hypothetical protein
MKRIIMVLVAALALAGFAAAQSARPTASPAQQIVKLSGKLELVDGMIGIKVDGVSYIVPRLRGLLGFVKEVQEGASVTLEGYAYPIPSKEGFSMLAITKLSIGGKDYDFGSGPGFGRFGGRGQRGGRDGWGGRMGGGMMGGSGPRW